MDQGGEIFGVHVRALTYRCIILKYKQIKIQKGDTTKIRAQQYKQLNTGAQEIKSNPERHDTRVPSMLYEITKYRVGWVEGDMH